VLKTLGLEPIVAATSSFRLASRGEASDDTIRGRTCDNCDNGVFGRPRPRPGLKSHAFAGIDYFLTESATTATVKTNEVE
jgi:hypothetical protein